MIDNKDNGKAEEEILLSAEAEDKTDTTDDNEDEAVTLSAESVKKSGKQKNFWGMLKRQKIMIISFASVALVMTVLYFAVLAPMVAKKQEPDPVIPETLVDGEVYDMDGTSILIFPHIEKKNIKSIEVTNSFGSFVCKRAEEENTFYIEEHMQVPFATETLTQLVVDAGYPTIIRRLTTDCEDWSVYGLAEEDNPAYYTVNTLDGQSHTVYIGDRSPTEGAFYCRYKDRDCLYVISSEVEYTLLSPVTSLLSPLLGFPISEAEVAKIDELILLKNGKPFVSINYKPIEGDEMALSAYEMIYPANYIVNDDNYATILLSSLSNLQGYSVVAAGGPDGLLRSDEEQMAKYGFYDLQNSPYELYYNYGGVTTIISFTESGMDGYYFAYSYLYDSIVLIEAATVPYLQWDMLEYIDYNLFSCYIADIDYIKVEGQLEYKKQTYDINEKFIYRQVQVDTKTRLQCSALSTGRTFTGNDPNQNPMQEFYGTVLSMRIQGYMKDEDVRDEDLNYYATLTVAKLDGETTVYKFYKYSSERCYYTVNGEGEFYILRRQVDKLMIDAARGAHGLKVESSNQYADLPEGFTGSTKYEE
ncbi:MAG: DUF4340 domain-containing protein [Ruminococcaceae bacterium]|nr:DUF4340 domain-containing protein [Oscillospiraceae bacterium]